MPLIETFLYSLQPADLAHLTPQAAELLSVEELGRWRQYRAPQSRDVFLASRFLLRKMLAERANCTAQALEFAAGDYGKPRVVGRAEAWQFNLSHSHDCVLLAVAQGLELGVDIEQRKARVSLADLAERIFTSSELATFLALDEPSQQTFFFDTWVLKESYIKLNGSGIWNGLNNLATDASTASYPEDAGTRAMYLRAPQGYSASLAYRAAQPVTVRQRHLQRLFE